MAHFAKVVNGIVTNVIVANQDFIDEYHSGETWVQTSYNTSKCIHYAPNSDVADDGVALRGNYAGIGHIYDSTNDLFYPQKKYASWVLNTSIAWWEAPITKPNDGKEYIWVEDDYQADNTQGWVEGSIND